MYDKIYVSFRLELVLLYLDTDVLDYILNIKRHISPQLFMPDSLFINVTKIILYCVRVSR